ncbi:hypothetical protein B0H14DRAFT_1476010 [Mycena olivaceomarginata]|nr:hypothetical protein B0H14DRAFT_1476010 [Mycena olivaceomarginata]
MSLPTTVPSLDTVTGALLVGTWVNSLLYTVEIIQVARYYRNFKSDGWMLKLFVGITCAVDALGMIGNYACVYLYTVTHGFDPSYLTNQYWPVPLFAFTTGITAALVQLFLVVRYWRLTKNVLVVLILSFFVIASLGGAFSAGVTLILFPAFTERAKIKVPGLIFLVSEAVSDLSISGALIWQFRKAKTAFQDTRSILDRLVTQTMQTGAAGATIAAAAAVAYLLNNESNVPVGIAYCLGRVYILTMLANLNIRQSGRTGASRATTSSSMNNQVRSGHPGVRTEGEDYGGIQIHRTAVVHIDGRPDMPFKSLPESDKCHGEESPTGDIEMTANDSESYSSKKKRALFSTDSL